MADLDISIKDATPEMQAKLNAAIARALEKIGITAQGYATLLCRVDTGRLRNSITYATTSKQGKPNTSRGKNKHGQPMAQAEAADYAMHGKPAETEVVLGTNVEYARKVEQNIKAFLKPAIENHISEYQKIFAQELSALSGD